MEEVRTRVSFDVLHLVGLGNFRNAAVCSSWPTKINVEHQRGRMLPLPSPRSGTVLYTHTPEAPRYVILVVLWKRHT